MCGRPASRQVVTNPLTHLRFSARCASWRASSSWRFRSAASAWRCASSASSWSMRERSSWALRITSSLQGQ